MQCIIDNSTAHLATLSINLHVLSKELKTPTSNQYTIGCASVYLKHAYERYVYEDDN